MDIQQSEEEHHHSEEYLMAKAASNVLTIEELAEYLKISRSTLYKLAQEGKLPAQKVGRHWRFHREAIDRWLGKRENESVASSTGEKKKLWRS